jgi:hypothetical protein
MVLFFRFIKANQIGFSKLGVVKSIVNNVELEPGIDKSLQFSCEFLMDIGNANTNYEIILQTKVLSRTWDFTVSPAIIHVVDKMNLPIKNGFTKGGTVLKFELPTFNSSFFPIGNDFNYTFSLGATNPDGIVFSNVCNLDGINLTCTTPSLLSWYSGETFSKNVELSLFINSIKAFDFIQNFFYQSNPTIQF